MNKYNTKQCSKCNIHKAINAENFEKSNSCKDGFRNDCKECRRKYRKEYYQKYNHDNREYVRERNKKYQKENKDTPKRINYRIQYNKKNRERINENRRKREKIRRANNPEKYRALDIIKFQKRRSLKKKTLTGFTNEHWASALEFFGEICAYCGCKNKMTQDHLVPLSKGGGYTKTNIIPSCSSCNRSKGAKDFHEWYPSQTFYDRKRELKIYEWSEYNIDDNGIQLELF